MSTCCGFDSAQPSVPAPRNHVSRGPADASTLSSVTECVDGPAVPGLTQPGAAGHPGGWPVDWDAVRADLDFLREFASTYPG